jgi:hypothetical protein
LAACLALACASGSGAGKGEPPQGQLLAEQSFELSAAAGERESRSWSMRGFRGLVTLRARVVSAHAAAADPPARVGFTLDSGSLRAGLYLEVSPTPRRGMGIEMREPLLLGRVGVAQPLALTARWRADGELWLQLGDDPQWHRLAVRFAPQTLSVSASGAQLEVERIAFYALEPGAPWPGQGAP